MQMKNFCNKLFICFLLMSLVTGCGMEETADKNFIEEETEEVSDEKIEEEQPEEIVTIEKSVETEEEIQPEKEETDRGVESPLAVYAAEQLGREFEGCHEADYDRDGEKEVIFSVKIERTDEKELDKLEIFFVDDDYKMTLIDTHEVGMGEDWRNIEGAIWGPEGDALMDYRGVPVFMQNLIMVGSVGHGFYREVYYGWTGKEIVKLKECEDPGLSVTTYLYDGSISPVTDSDFLKICNGDFSGVTGREENLIENLEDWYKNRWISGEFDYYLECDVDHDGTNELYIADTSGRSAAVFHKGEEGIECWVCGSTLALSDNGNFWYVQETCEEKGRWHERYRTNTVISFDSNGNQDIMEYKEVTVLYEKSANKEDWTILDKCAFRKLCFYYRNENPVTEKEYYESFRESLFGCSRKDIIEEEKIELGGYSIIYPAELNDWLKEKDDTENLLLDYGLEKYPELNETYYLSDLELAEQEQIIMLEIYDYDISQYIEESIWTIDNEAVVCKYKLLISRESGLLGYCRNEADYYNNNIKFLKETLRDVISRHATTRAGIDFFPPFHIQGINEDGTLNVCDGLNVYTVDKNGLTFREKFISSNDSVQEVSNGKRVEESGKEYYRELISVSWERNYIQMENIPHADFVNKQIKSETESDLKELLALCADYKDNDFEITGSDGKAWIQVIISGTKIVYQSDQYLAIVISSWFRPLWDGSVQFHYKHKIICFDLEKGERISLEDMTDAGYTEQDLKNIIWIGYEEQMKKASDKYTKECFEEYYERLFHDGKEWYTGISQNDGYEEKNLDEYIHYYFNEEGIVFYFNRDWEGIPVEYLLDENFTTEVELRISIPLEKMERTFIDG